MKIGFLTCIGISNNEEYIKAAQVTLAKLEQSASNLGQTGVTLNIEKIRVFYDHGKTILYYNDKPFDCDVVLSRIGNYPYLNKQLYAVRDMELAGVTVLNGYYPTLTAKNKLLTLQVLSRDGIPVPRTTVLREKQDTKAAVDFIGGFPLVLKFTDGSWGKGVILIENEQTFAPVLDALWENDETQLLLLQEYIAESRGADTRAFVVGDRVVASMARKAKTGDFRSNIHAGGVGQKQILSDDELEMAIGAVKAVGLDIAGVDIIQSKHGPLVLEVNSSPGIQISRVCGIDVAKAMVEYAISKVKK